MAKRQKAWARRKTAELRRQLGGVCARCGKRRRNLEFDCIIPQGHKHHRMEFSWRMSFYNAQFQAGNLQLLCDPCHNRKSALDEILYYSLPVTQTLTLSPA